MQVIFIKDLRKQGKKGEIKTVKDGYAQNFLIRNGYAVPVNEHNLNELNNQNKKEQAQDEKNKEEATKLKEELDKKGYKIDKKQIELNQSISSLGYHDVNINLYGNINAKVKVHVIK